MKRLLFYFTCRSIVFWNKHSIFAGFMFLWNGDEKNDRGSSTGSDWIRSVMGLDGILNQPNMLVGWISGQAARSTKI